MQHRYKTESSDPLKNGCTFKLEFIFNNLKSYPNKGDFAIISQLNGIRP